MLTEIDLTTLVDELPPRRLGSILRNARWRAGLSVNEVREATRGAVSPRWLGAVERGRRRPSLAHLELLTSLYGVDLGALVGSARRELVVDLATGRLEMGRHRVDLASTDADEVVAQFLDLVNANRARPLDRVQQVRVRDLETLGMSLGRSRRALVADLRSLMRHEAEVETGLLAIPAPPVLELESGAGPADTGLTDSGLTESGPVDTGLTDSGPASTVLTEWALELVDGPVRARPIEGPVDLDPIRLEELDAVRDAIFATPSVVERLALTRRQERHEALRRRQRELLDELGFTTWSSMIIAISRGEAFVANGQPRMLALNPAPVA